MSANSESWLTAHGRLWYDDRWYRMAWIAWPQAIGLLLFATLWLLGPIDRGFVPWARPIAPAKAQSAPAAQPQTAPPLAEKALDPLAACRGQNHQLVIQTCTTLLTSGNLRGNDLTTAYWLRGEAYGQLQRYREAIDDLTQAISLNPRDFRPYADRALAWAKSGNVERALQDYDQAIAIDGNQAVLHLYRGLLLRDLKRPDDALASLNKSISLDPKVGLAYLHRAYIYVERHDYRASFDDANKLIELNQNGAKGYELRAQAYYEFGQYQPVVNDLTKAIEINSGSSAWDWRYRGFANYRLNQFDAALADLLKARELEPNDHSGDAAIDELKARKAGQQQNSALAPCKTMDAMQIIQACGALLASGNLTGSDLATAYGARGWAYRQTKQYQLAMNDLNQAIALDTRQRGLYDYRGDLWRDLGNYEHALRDYDQALQLDPNHAPTHAVRGLTLADLKRVDEALTEYDKAIKLDPKFWQAYRGRALLYYGRGDWYAVMSDADKIIELKPDIEDGYAYHGAANYGIATTKIANNIGTAGELERAIADFTKAISINSRNTFTLRNRGRANYLLGQADSAMSDYQAALRIDANDSTTISYVNELKRAQRRR